MREKKNILSWSCICYSSPNGTTCSRLAWIVEYPLWSSSELEIACLARPACQIDQPSGLCRAALARWQRPTGSKVLWKDLRFVWLGHIGTPFVVCDALAYQSIKIQRSSPRIVVARLRQNVLQQGFRHRRKNNPCRWRLLAINLYWERHHGTITNGRYFCRVNRCYIQLFYAASDSTILNGLIFKIGTRKWHLILDANFAWQSPFWTASITKSFLCLFIS